MNQAEYDKFIKTNLEQTYPRGSDLQNQAPRTLIYGYTCDRDTFHAYLDEAHVLNRVIYSHDGFLLSHADEFSPLLAADYVPEKRAYPETCDLAFCQVLERAGVDITFTVFSADRLPAVWYGKRKEELIAVEPDDHLAPIVFSVEELGLGDQVNCLSEYRVEQLERDVSVMVTEMFDKVYRRVKYTQSDELPKWLDSLPGNVEWSIRKVFETLWPMVTDEFKFDPAVADALRTKVKAAVLSRLHPATAQSDNGELPQADCCSVPGCANAALDQGKGRSVCAKHDPGR